MVTYRILRNLANVPKREVLSRPSCATTTVIMVQIHIYGLCARLRLVVDCTGIRSIMVDQDGKKRGAQPRLQSISFHGQTQFVRHNARLRTSSYASRSAVCSSDSPTSFLPFGKNQRSKISPCSSSWYCSRRTTTLPVDGWMMTIPAPSIKSCAGHRLSETPGEENGNVETRSCRVSRVERVCPRRALDGPFEPKEEFTAA